ncbi:helix-turn-helix domain-containing protein [Chitinophaga sp. GbtcB8]|uniref:helix-turn-helix domain-containing protein n=1 Tax=Chitinophaga sp. GbtcB8 TaxID=2824753 RepID=UPI001C3102DB|nr:AraC family transcriptional regulator [Chitinophaga sp. GbtcB8]
MQLPEDIYQRIVAAKLFMDEHYHESIDLGEISGQAFLSRFHFHRLFTRIYRSTPHRYLTRRRMDKARDLLAQEGLSVSEICTSVGFESIGSFSTLFKKETGIGPQHYRNLRIVQQQQAKAQPRTFIPHCFIEGYKLNRQ